MVKLELMKVNSQKNFLSSNENEKKRNASQLLLIDDGWETQISCSTSKITLSSATITAAEIAEKTLRYLTNYLLIILYIDILHTENLRDFFPKNFQLYEKILFIAIGQIFEIVLSMRS